MGFEGALQAKDRMISHANQLKEMLRRRNVPLIINDRVDVAILVSTFLLFEVVGRGRRAHRPVGHGRGVMSPAARPVQDSRCLGADALAGGEGAARRRGLFGLRRRVPYAVGSERTVERRSKDDADAVGLEGLRRVCEAVSIPVVSIGGVTAGNAGATMKEGAVGVAVISAIFGRSDVKEAAKELRDAVEKAL